MRPQISGPKPVISVDLMDADRPDSTIPVLICFLCVFTALTGAATPPDHVRPCHESISRLSRCQHTETAGILGL